MNVQIQSATEAEQVAEQVEDRAERTAGGARLMHAEAAPGLNPDEDPEAVALRAQQLASAPQAQRPIVNGHHVGRNDPCPCGSGKKYKHCHGKLA